MFCLFIIVGSANLLITPTCTFLTRLRLPPCTAGLSFVVQNFISVWLVVALALPAFFFHDNKNLPPPPTPTSLRPSRYLLRPPAPLRFQTLLYFVDSGLCPPSRVPPFRRVKYFLLLPCLACGFGPRGTCLHKRAIALKTTTDKMNVLEPRCYMY